jgi:DNA repair protein RadC
MRKTTLNKKNNNDMAYDIISKRSRKSIKIKRPDDLYLFLKRYTKNRQEIFFAISLNNSHEIIGIHISTIGIMDKTFVHPREIFYHLIKDNASSFIVAHNHPSGHPVPSGEDIENTKRLLKASEIMGFHFLDHIIITKDNFCSIREKRLIPEWTDD